jgi:ParB/RepB/Spo0J family partition protein
VTPIQEIDVVRIRPGRAVSNDRKVFNQHELEELAEQIAKYGLLNPIHVRPSGPDDFEIVTGERRWRAVMLLIGKQEPAWVNEHGNRIPAQVREVDDRTASGLMLMENLQRKDLDPIEEGGAYAARMRDFDLSVEEIALEVNRSVDRVQARIDLLRLSETAQHLVRTKQLPIGHALRMVDLDQNRQAIALASLEKAGRRPEIGEWAAYCSLLLEQQQDEPLFDTSSFTLTAPEPELPALSPDGDAAAQAVSKLPPIRNRKGGTRTVLTQYLEQLQSDGHEAAEVLESVIAELNRCPAWARLDVHLPRKAS